MTVSLRNTPLLVTALGTTSPAPASTWNGTAPVAGDLLVAVVQLQGSSSTTLGTTPAGWALSAVNETNSAGSEARTAVFTRTATGTSADNAPAWPETASGTAARCAGEVILYDFRDSSGFTPVLYTYGVAQGTTGTVAPVTAAAVPAGSYAIAGTSAQGTSATTVTWTTPSGWTSQGISSGSTYYHYANWSLAAPAAGSTLTCSMAHSAGTTAFEAAFVLAVAPPVVAGLATAVAAADRPAIPEDSPALELSGFGTFAGIGSSDTINSVTVTVTEHQSSAAMPACTFELWDYSGFASQIGTTQTGTAGTGGGNASSATFTGVTYAMLSTLRVRVYGHSGPAGSGAVESVDAVSLTVNYSPARATTATAGPAVAAGKAGAPVAELPSAALAGFTSVPGLAVPGRFRPGAADTAAVVLATAGLATASGPSAQSPVTVTVTATAATAAGAADQPSPHAGLATATGIAQPPAPAVAVGAGLAAATGTAGQPAAAVTAGAGLATAAGSAGPASVPAAAIRAGLATATGSAFAYFSRLHVAGGRLRNSGGGDLGQLKGFDVLVGAGGDTFVWSQADYSAMAAAGAKIVRQAVFWDILEPTAGSLDSTLLATLDTAIARAANAGLYTVLDCPHLNLGRTPSWAQTEANEWLDYVVHGQYMTQQIATRYASNVSVIGMAANEPPAADLGSMMTGYQTIVPWYTSIATAWPVWLSGGLYGAGTPYPTGAFTQLNPATYKALDVNGTGCIIQYHDYLNADNGDTTTYPEGHQPNGTEAVTNQVGAAGWQFHGWGDNWNYPNTAQSRADLAAHIADMATFTATYSSFVLAVEEFGMDNTQSGEPAYGTDKGNCFNAVKAQIQMWWDYDTAAVTTNGFSARPSGTWRASVSNWLALAPPPWTSVNAGLATASGTAQVPMLGPVVAVTAGLATATGTALNPPVAVTVTASAGGAGTAAAVPALSIGARLAGTGACTAAVSGATLRLTARLAGAGRASYRFYSIDISVFPGAAVTVLSAGAARSDGCAARAATGDGWAAGASESDGLAARASVGQR